MVTLDGPREAFFHPKPVTSTRLFLSVQPGFPFVIHSPWDRSLGILWGCLVNHAHLWYANMCLYVCMSQHKWMQTCIHGDTLHYIYVPTSTGVCQTHVHGVNVHPCMSLISLPSGWSSFLWLSPHLLLLHFYYAVSPPQPLSPLDLANWQQSVRRQRGVTSQYPNPHRDKILIIKSALPSYFLVLGGLPTPLTTLYPTELASGLPPAAQQVNKTLK